MRRGRRRGVRALAAGLVTVAIGLPLAAGLASPASSAAPVRPVIARLLVVAGSADELDLGAIRSTLDRIGLPYDTLIASRARLTSETLERRGIGNYQGVVLTTDNLIWNDPASRRWVSAFDAGEWRLLWAYEAKYRVRQVSLYTYPDATPERTGLKLAPTPFDDTRTQPLLARLTPAGARVFADLNPRTPISFRLARVYLARKADPRVTPLLETAKGDVIASTRSFPNGRESLSLTAQNSETALHSKLLAYGIVNWVTRGVFLGWRKVTFDAQIDDLFTPTAMWRPGRNGSAVNPKATNGVFRIGGDDLRGLARWQVALSGRSPLLRSVKLEWAFNGYGSGVPISKDDDLTPAVLDHLRTFNYINHTFSHQTFDGLGYELSRFQIQKNFEMGEKLGMVNWSRDTLVQPSISGLTNQEFFKAAHDTGIRYLISDTSVPVWSNPSPNAGFYVETQPSILVIPRHATDLYYDVRTRQQWIDEYNAIYWKGSPSDSGSKFFSTRRTYAQIIDRESDKLLSYLVSWDVDPLMFHQANTGLYDGRRSLLSDLLDATFAKYTAAYRLPVQNLTMQQVGRRIADRMAYDRAGALAVITPCTSISVSVARAAPIPLTGVSGGTTETYGGQALSTVHVSPSTPRTLPLRCA